MRTAWTSTEHIEAASNLARFACEQAYGVVDVLKNTARSEAASRAAVANLHAAAMIQSHHESASQPLLEALEAIAAVDGETDVTEAQYGMDKMAEIARAAVSAWSAGQKEG